MSALAQGWSDLQKRKAIVVFLFCILSYTGILLAPAKEQARTDDYVGSLACATCHSSIYQSYSATPMALSSGRVGAGAFQESFAASNFFHPRSGVRYRVFKEQNDYYFDFTREASVASSHEIRGRRRLDYFIGSGAAGRSYLFSIDRFLFQAPVSYYSKLKQWNMSPGFDLYKEVRLTRPVEAACLECHASRLQAVPGTQNRFDKVPYLEGGVSCERCHGPGKQHVIKMSSGGGSREIVNPAKLEPRRRDSVCAQCHLTGEARITREGRSLSTFRPGDLLSSHVTSFVWSSGARSGIKVTSHFENLWQSACKKASGDRLSCLSCHDPHTVPVETERKEYFRGKCFSCHQNLDCKLKIELRARKGNDCIACHMPKSAALDVGHTVFTDHSIPRRIGGRPRPEAGVSERSLISFWGGDIEGARELGLAYAEAAVQEQNDVYYARAFELLKKAEPERPRDARLLEQLAYLYEHFGDENKAMTLYRRAVQADPSQVVAAVNLGSLLAKRGRFQEAIPLWEDALSRNPGLETASVYLALAYLRVANPAAAETALLKTLEYNPDSHHARRLLSDLRQQKNQ